MTAFDNIKTNNWPATSNEFEDYLVLELPFNDSAALVESLRDIVVSDKVLHPKVALTNSSVVLGEAGPKWDASTTGSPYNGSWDVVFDGNATATTSTQGASYWHYTYESTTSVTLKQAISGQIEILAGRPGSNDSGTHSITLQSGGSDVHTVTLGTNGASGYQWFDFGTRSNIDKFVITGGDPGVAIWAVRLDNVLLVNPTGGPKKHYDNSAIFDGSTSELTVPADSRFNLSGDFTIEAWTYQDAAVAYGTIIGTGGYYSGSNGGNWILRRTSATQIAFASYDGQGNAEYVELSATTSLNTWHHIALVRSGTTVQIYVDGVAGGSMTVTKGLEDGANNGLKIGNTSGNSRWNGKFQDIRIYNGVAKYTANFTPPGAILS